MLRRLLPSLVAALLALAACAGGTNPPSSLPTDAATQATDGSGSWRYSLVIDASSSASTLFMYQWRESDGRRLPWIQAAPYPRAAGNESWTTRVKPGLGAYADRPAEAARSLAPLIEYALEKIGDDPEALAETSVYVLGTAGVRPLPAEQKAAIIQAISDYLETTPLSPTSVRAISGVEEGVYGWLSVNYLLGHLEHGGRFPTVGALDLGGASTQITFVPLDHPREHRQAVSLRGQTYQVYTHSYLGYGQDEARRTVASPACFIDGYPIPEEYDLASGTRGTGDWPACLEAIRDRLSRPCAEKPCSLFGVYQPPLYGDFLAFSVYAYAADFFELRGSLSPARMSAAGQAFCTQDWQLLVANDPSVENNPYLPNYCFSAAYIVTLLSEAFDLPDATERVQAPLAVQGTDVGWALGALLYELAGDGD